MKKKYLLGSLALFIILSGCAQSNTVDNESNTADNEINKEEMISLHSQVNFLTQELNTLQQSKKLGETEKEMFPIIVNHTRSFVEGLKTGDIKAIESVTDSEVKIEERNNSLFFVSPESDYEWEIYNTTSKNNLQDWSFQKIDYVENEEDIEEDIVVLIRLSYLNPNSKTPEISQTDFLKLKFKLIDDNWKIAEIVYDI